MQCSVKKGVWGPRCCCFGFGGPKVGSVQVKGETEEEVGIKGNGVRFKQDALLSWKKVYNKNG